MKIPILMYHSISSEQNKLSVPQKNFENQMQFMKKNNYKSINFDELDNLDKKSKYFIITFDDGYEDVYTQALPVLKKFNYTSTCYFVSNLIGKYNIWDENESNFYKMNLMNFNQILSWQKNGMSIGIHTANHKNLSNINLNEKKYEIFNSINFFKSKLSLDVKYFSYPFGKYDNQTLDIIRNNFKFAVTTKRSRYSDGKFNYHELPRVPINKDTSLFKFFLKIKTPYEDIKYNKS